MWFVVCLVSAHYISYFVVGIAQQQVYLREDGSDDVFRYTFLLTTLASFTNFLSALVALWTVNGFSWRRVYDIIVRRVRQNSTLRNDYLWVSLTFTAGKVAGNHSLTVVDYATQALAKCAKPVSVVILGMLHFNLKFNSYDVICSIWIVLSLLVFNMLAHPPGTTPSRSQAMSTAPGYLLLLFSLICDGFTGARLDKLVHVIRDHRLLCLPQYTSSKKSKDDTLEESGSAPNSHRQSLTNEPTVKHLHHAVCAQLQERYCPSTGTGRETQKSSPSDTPHIVNFSISGYPAETSPGGNTTTQRHRKLTRNDTPCDPSSSLCTQEGGNGDVDVAAVRTFGFNAANWENVGQLSTVAEIDYERSKRFDGEESQDSCYSKDRSVGTVELSTGSGDGSSNSKQLAGTCASYEMMCTINLLTALISGFCSVLIDGWDGFSYLHKHSSTAIAVSLFCIVGALGQFCSFKAVSHLGYLQTSTITTTRKVVMVVVSVLWFNTPMHYLQWIAVASVGAAVMWRSSVSYRTQLWSNAGGRLDRTFRWIMHRMTCKRFCQCFSCPFCQGKSPRSPEPSDKNSSRKLVETVELSEDCAQMRQISSLMKPVVDRPVSSHPSTYIFPSVPVISTESPQFVGIQQPHRDTDMYMPYVAVSNPACEAPLSLLTYEQPQACELADAHALCVAQANTEHGLHPVDRSPDDSSGVHEKTCDSYSVNETSGRNAGSFVSQKTISHGTDPQPEVTAAALPTVSDDAVVMQATPFGNNPSSVDRGRCDHGVLPGTPDTRATASSPRVHPIPG
eukprot:GHVQ01014522.1.p1 GENE.GHVQ01014522.1~~GHVQ01014522.1.p1  ORF type:complete len:789 (+),score=74.06 GHVQ01014522.1:371-2737(+)